MREISENLAKALRAFSDAEDDLEGAERRLRAIEIEAKNARAHRDRRRVELCKHGGVGMNRRHRNVVFCGRVFMFSHAGPGVGDASVAVEPAEVVKP